MLPGAPLDSVTLPRSVDSICYTAFARTANEITAPDLSELRIENSELSVLDTNGKICENQLAGVTPQKTTILGPTCSAAAVYAKKWGHAFTPIGDSRHTFGEWVKVKEASCEEAGEKTRSCSVCGITETQTVEATGHSWGDWITITAATCTQKGEEEHYCTECAERETRETELVAHTEERRGEVTPDCTHEGYTGDIYCSVCDALLEEGIVIPVTDHIPEVIAAKDPTCEEDGNTAGSRCSVCGATLSGNDTLYATGHSWSDVTYTWAEDNRTVTAVRSCVNDPSHVEEETVDTIEDVREASCTETGERSITTKAFQNPAFTEQSKTMEIPMADHTPEVVAGEPATCGKPGHSSWTRCAVCGGEIDPPDIFEPTGEHDYVREVVSEPTCSTWGIAKLTCSVCGEEQEENIETKAHSFKKYIYNNDATCELDGTETATCETCNETTHTRTAEGTRKGHEQQAVPGRKATCTEEGLTDGAVCSECGQVLKEQEIIPATGHHYGDVVFEWTEDKNGGVPNTYDNMPWYSWGAAGKVTCSTCGHVETLSTTTYTFTPDDSQGEAGKIIFLAQAYFNDGYRSEQKTIVLKSPETPTVEHESKKDEDGSNGQGTKADRTAAGKASESILALKKADSLTLADKPAVEAARKAFDGLTDAQKALVSSENLKKLTAAEKKIQSLEKNSGKESGDEGKKDNGKESGDKGKKDNKGAATGSVVKGRVYVVSGMKYKVTNADPKGNGTVTLKGTTVKKKKLKKLSVPAVVTINGIECKVTAIGSKAFRGYTKLRSVSIGKNVKSIGSSAFANNTALKKVTIGKSVRKIGKSAFRGCKKLKTITFKTSRLTAKKVGAKAFQGTPAKATVKVPKKVKKAYAKWLVKKGLSKKAKVK